MGFLCEKESGRQHCNGDRGSNRGGPARCGHSSGVCPARCGSGVRREGRAGHVVTLVVAVAILVALILVADADVNLG